MDYLLVVYSIVISAILYRLYDIEKPITDPVPDTSGNAPSGKKETRLVPDLNPRKN
jgi:hypothetical protein